MPEGTLNWCICAVHGKALFGSYMPLNAVGEGAAGPVGVCAAGRLEGWCELATSGMAQNKARPLNRNSMLSVTRAIIGTEEFVFIISVV
jgi:hypothetical protein